MSEAISVLLTGADTASARNFREESRQWRKQDIQWRSTQEDRFEQRRRFTEEKHAWRVQDLDQTALENARRLWNRHVAANVREVGQHLEKLRTIGELAALVAGFTINSAFLNFQYDLPGDHLLVPFGLCMSLVALLEICSMLICALLLTAVVRVGKDFVSEEEEAEFMARCHAFVTRYQPGQVPPAPRRTFSRYWSACCEPTWRLAYCMFLAGVPLMVASLSLAGFVKFESFDFPTNISVGILVSSVLGGALALGLLLNRRWLKALYAGEEGRGDGWQAGSTYHRPCLGMPYDWHIMPSRAAHPVRPSSLLW